MEIYKPCMDGLAPPGAGVADTIGTFTTTIRVAQDMFLTSLPCWLIWSSSMFGDEKIFSIAEIFSPKDYIVLEPHKHNYPIIFKGPATNFEKYCAIEIFACNFLCSRDPFAMTCTPSSLSLAGASQPSSSSSQPSTLSTPAVASSSATQHLTGRNSGGPVHKPARGRGAGKSSAFDILIYYYIILLKVLVNRHIIMGIINSS